MWLGGLYTLEIVIMTISLVLSVQKSRSLANCETILPLTIIGYG